MPEEDKPLVKEAAKKTRKARRSTKGALIKEKLSGLSSEILKNKGFAKFLKTTMQRYGGIYALYRGEQLYYVGLTQGFHGRIKKHLKDQHEDKWDSFAIFRIQQLKYLQDIETLITNLINTPGNRVKGTLPQDKELNRALRDALEQHKQDIHKIEKAFKR